jgi:uncharacterized protein (TIGR03083 family)
MRFGLEMQRVRAHPVSVPGGFGRVRAPGASTLRGMDTPSLIDALESNGTRLLDAASIGPDRPVAACPGWDVARLVGHVGQIHSWMTGVIEANTTERPTHAFTELPDGDPVEWERAILARLVEVLRTTDPDRATWTWAGLDTVRWYARRMAHETTVHRWDVEDSVGATTPIDSDLAADGVDELIDVGLQRSMNPSKEFGYPTGSLHLHRTDGDGEWLLRVEDGSLIATREHAKGDVAVRGAGPDLLLYMWGRNKENLEIFGDSALVDAWASVAP